MTGGRSWETYALQPTAWEPCELAEAVGERKARQFMRQPQRPPVNTVETDLRGDELLAEWHRRQRA